VGSPTCRARSTNTIVTITDTNGDTLCHSSGGAVGFKGSRKSTPFAAQRAAEECAGKAQKFGVKKSKCGVKGRAPPRVGRHGPSGRGAQRQGDRRRHPAPAQRLRPPKSGACSLKTRFLLWKPGFCSSHEKPSFQSRNRVSIASP